MSIPSLLFHACHLGDRTWAPSASRGPFPCWRLGSSLRTWISATLTRGRRTLWWLKFRRPVPPAAGAQWHPSPRWAGAGGADPTRRPRVAGVKSERLRAKPQTKAALGGPRRAPSQGNRCPRAPSPRRRLQKRLSSIPRSPRGAAPRLVRSWCKQRAAHWDPPETSGARGGRWRARRDPYPTQRAPTACTHRERRLQGEPAARELRPSTHHEPQPGAPAPVRTHQAKAPAARAPGTRAVPSPAPGQGRRRLGRRAQEGADSPRG